MGLQLWRCNGHAQGSPTVGKVRPEDSSSRLLPSTSTSIKQNTDEAQRRQTDDQNLTPGAHAARAAASRPRAACRCCGRLHGDGSTEALPGAASRPLEEPGSGSSSQRAWLLRSQGLAGWRRRLRGVHAAHGRDGFRGEVLNLFLPQCFLEKGKKLTFSRFKPTLSLVTLNRAPLRLPSRRPLAAISGAAGATSQACARNRSPTYSRSHTDRGACRHPSAPSPYRSICWE